VSGIQRPRPLLLMSMTNPLHHHTDPSLQDKEITGGVRAGTVSGSKIPAARYGWSVAIILKRPFFPPPEVIFQNV
jgi:hypothetical protein